MGMGSIKKEIRSVLKHKLLERVSKLKAESDKIVKEKYKEDIKNINENLKKAERLISKINKDKKAGVIINKDKFTAEVLPYDEWSDNKIEYLLDNFMVDIASSGYQQVKLGNCIKEIEKLK